MFLSFVLLATAIGAEPISPAWPQPGVAAPSVRIAPAPAMPAYPAMLPRYPSWPATVPPPAAAEYRLNDWQWQGGQLQPGSAPAMMPPAVMPPAEVPSAVVPPTSPFRIPFIDPPLPLENTLGYYDPFTRQLAFGNAGFQPYRLGWYFYDELPYMFTAPVRGVTGSFQDLEYNSSVRYATTMGDRLLFTWTGSWYSSWWTGPSGVNLPGTADQLMSDFQISSLNAGPWNWQVGVTPQLNTDFHRSLDHNAYMMDGRFVLFYQTVPEWRWAAGLEYWNRVHGIIIPYGGVTWAPNDRWEVRAFFPKSRISRYYGNLNGTDIWHYVSIGWNVNAWQVTLQNQIETKTRMQMSYVELLAGVSAASGAYTAFVEAGLIFDRRVLFRASAPPFTINSNGMIRIGILY